MNFLLLTGAGFSRNWGGWLANEAFEYLLGCPQVRSNASLRQILWRHQLTGGFESALAEVKRNYVLNPQTNLLQLQDIQAAVSSMFTDMNQAYFEVNDFEFQHQIPRMVRSFMVKFDAIFTLNQDLLLEHHYLNENIALTLPRKWNGAQLPGMRPTGNVGGNWAQFDWSPMRQGQFVVTANMQPLFKLHGSSNWHDPAAGPLLIMGANKVRDIEFHPILSWYFQQFEERLARPETRLMVIGYGFRDEHINQAIINAINQHGLEVFLIDPSGAELARRLNQTRGAAIQAPPSPLEDAFATGLIGASRRPLRSIFGGDTVEYAKVQRFFAP